LPIGLRICLEKGGRLKSKGNMLLTPLGQTSVRDQQVPGSSPGAGSMKDLQQTVYSSKKPK
jgi:hypothetical protein